MEIIDVNPGDRIMFVAGEGMSCEEITALVNGMTTTHRIAVVDPGDVTAAFVIRAGQETPHPSGPIDLAKLRQVRPLTPWPPAAEVPTHGDGRETVPISDLLLDGRGVE